MYPEVRTAATAIYVNLIKSVGNLPGGVSQVCEMRANILVGLKMLNYMTENQSNLFSGSPETGNG